MKGKDQKQKGYLPCIICKKRRIKPTHRYHLLGQTRTKRVSGGMCKVCAWNEVKERCLICGEVLDKGYPQLLAHCIAHYTDKDDLYDNDDNYIKAIALNFEIITPANFQRDSDVIEFISCNICHCRFPLYDVNKELQTYPSRWLDHIVGHYSDSRLIEKEWIAREIVNFNYEAVVVSKDNDDDDGGARPGGYRLLTEEESKVYAEALHRMKTTEDEINRRKNK